MVEWTAHAVSMDIDQLHRDSPAGAYVITASAGSLLVEMTATVAFVRRSSRLTAAWSASTSACQIR